MPNKSKGVRQSWRNRANRIQELRKKGAGWADIGRIIKMDRSNVRRTFRKYYFNAMD